MHRTLSPHEQHLVEAGLARAYDLADGRTVVVPIISGGDPAGDPLFPTAPEDFTALSDEDLASFIESSETAAASVAADPGSFLTDTRDGEALLAEMTAGVEALEAARAEDDSREPAEVEEEVEPDADLAAGLEALAARATPPVVEAPPATPAAVVEPPAEVEPPAAPPAEIVAAAPPAVVTPPRPPARSRAAAPPAAVEERITLTASVEGFGRPIGAELDLTDVGDMMIRRRSQFGAIPKGTSGEKVGIARASWKHLFTGDTLLDSNIERTNAIIASILDQAVNKAELRRRRNADPGSALSIAMESLAASGGLCAPPTPYYALAQIAQAMRPVRAALPSFGADRGGIRFARPGSLADITTEGVDIRTVAEDFAGGTEGAKTCQTITCPDWEEVDVAILFHCLQYGNLGARAWPERLAQWNAEVLAAHARLAETQLLTGIDAASTAVTAASLGLGATAALLGQILAAANGMRNRNRMDPEAVLRLMLPDWSIDLMVSDVIRGQFQRFETDRAKLTALLRSFNVEPTFYIDGANGAGQVFGAQGATTLLPFPSTVRWYLYPEGSFLYLDGGTLELGLVRDSVLNASNDFQIFGETFENVAFIGVESLAVTSTICDSGTVALPHAVPCPIDYSHTT